MKIRPVQINDAPEWLRMRLALYRGSDPISEKAEIDHFLAQPALPPLPTLHAVFVAERAAGSLCGFIETSIRPYADGCETRNVGYLEAWYVDRDMRKEGIGGELVAAAENWAREQGCREMASDTEPYNIISQAVHEKLGYSEVGRIVQYCKKLD